MLKKLTTWMDELEQFNIEKKKMRREDRLGEVDYAALNKQDEEQRNNLQNDTPKKPNKITRLINKYLLFFAVASLAFTPMSYASDHGMKKNIVDVAAANGSFNTLVAAVKAAGLVDTLKEDAPFTVFAPTDEAFAKLPEGTVDMLLKPENKDQLVAVLTYHVVSGKVNAADIVKIDSADTVQGQKVMVTVNDGSVMINDATVIMADVEASNGVIHVIDTVLLPK